MTILTIQLLISAFIIIFSGTKLCRYADIISEKTNLSKAFTGMLFLGIITSLPELTTTITAATVRDAPDLSAGNIYGSNTLNLIILAFLALLSGKPPLAMSDASRHTNRISMYIIASASLMGAASIFAQKRILFPRIFTLGIDTFAILLLVITGFAIIYKHESAISMPESTAVNPRGKFPEVTLKSAFGGFSVNAVLVVSSGIWLTSTGDEIALLTGLGRTFIGSTIVALITSFPEIVTSIAAIRSGSPDMAIGNIFGSNLFNLCLIPATDIVFVKGNMLSVVSQTHIITALLGVVLIFMAYRALTNQKKSTVFSMKYISIAMISLYFAATYILFRFR